MPECSQRQKEHDESQTILVVGHSGIHWSAIRGVATTEIAVILNEEHRSGQQKKANAREETFKSGYGLSIRNDDQDHRQVSDGFNPALERNVRMIGPTHAHKTIQKVNQDRPVCGDQSTRPLAPPDKDNYRSGQEEAEKERVDGTTIKLDIRPVGRSDAQPE